jgi:predicted nuclease with RNAse H fold
VRALGIDVGVRKGLDLVVLDQHLRPVERHRHVALEELGTRIAATDVDVIAVDSPPGWARRNGTRRTERELRVFGIHSYGTPTADRGTNHDFYAWMRVGFEVFRIAEEHGYPRHRGGPVRGTAIEVFPHATAVVLSGCVPRSGIPRTRWRTSILASRGVATGELRGPDQIDAALAALTGLEALRGRCSALGDPTEGVIVLPARTLPPHPYPRCPEPSPDEVQARLPRMSPCACGDPTCDRLTSREFAPGHDARRKAMLWRMSRAGQEATDELRRRRWELPPEMR